VLRAFGQNGDSLERLPGGQGASWRAGRVVLKPVDDVFEAVWVAQLVAGLTESGFRVPRPVPAASGDWVQDGWAAWTLVIGEHDHAPRRWADVFSVATEFHAAVADAAFPDALRARRHAWAEGDRVAWQEAPARVVDAHASALLDRLADGLRPLDLVSQVIHGDLAGNVLFAPSLPPAIIDFSPYHRPAAFALAVVVNDAIAWYDAPFSIVDSLPDVADLDQLLRRTAIYRLVTAARLAESRPGILSDHVRAHERVADLVEALG
jgi:uncharacterized protein (TIGR02569 family)